ncbi:LemA family protein [Caenimonas aquaedulcis]|uniref:LemA family protein n=1 Tax=Caenimonas aquaedulcis TaxID=2793270 RepID=A0A931MHZ5_9BURK|nr:LemA family protein [Caenimonas aquaedulcis]MBG9389313.1 LemA family protein [Caenimonas aquaedulcis]
MPSSWVMWVAAAVVLFWGVGAYNRLMRLRAEANQAFGALDAELAKQVTLVRECLPPQEGTQPAPLGSDDRFWSGLEGAASQFAASLAAARARPLEPERIAALASAQSVLATAWERAERDDAHDLAGSRLPENVSARRQQIVIQTHAATDQFDLAVARYNHGIAQFPAVLLALLFAFKPGRGVRAAHPSTVP